MLLRHLRIRWTLLLMLFVPVQAQSEGLLAVGWDGISDAMREALLDGGNPQPFEDILAKSATGQPPQSLSGGGIVQIITGTGATLAMVLGGDGTEVSGYAMSMSGSEDIAIPPLGGAFSNCTEVNPDTCKRMNLTRRSDLTLGVAACICEAGAQTLEWRGQRLAVIPCYLGRGGAYMQYLLAYPDGQGRIATMMPDAASPGRAALCRASTAFASYPEFLADRVSDPGVVDLSGLDADLWPGAIFAENSGGTEAVWTVPQITEQAFPAP